MTKEFEKTALQVTGVSVSKKGTVWIQAKLIDGPAPKTNEIFQCELLGMAEEKEKQDVKTEN